MSLRLNAAAVRAYDLLKQRAGVRLRRSDARDPAVVEAVTRRLEELVAQYRVGGHEAQGATFVFWTEVERQVECGAFDDLMASV